ncbi:TPA: dephospho-CoA kinase [Candidatus Poribacteria bacterium]|nr:dephospho-CoA kinase [Candidatus Poribacteria bacterium]
MKRGLIVGLTGGIACGKTTVAKMMQERGAHVIDVDDIGHEMLKRGSPVYEDLVKAFGPEVLDESGDISRRKLGRLVFQNPEMRERLNEIVHPQIIRTSLERARKSAGENPCGIVVLDAPLLFEVGMEREVDVTVVVTADERKQVERQIERWREMGREVDEREALARIRAQMPLKRKIEMADFVIENNGSIEELREKVGRVWRKLCLLSDLACDKISANSSVEDVR